MLYRNMKAQDVDEYIAQAPPEMQAILRELRKVVRKAAPNSQEVIAWGMPCYKQNGYLVGFIPYTKHVGFGLIHQLPTDVRKVLDEKGYKTGSKSFPIQLDQDIPVDEIKQIIDTQIALNNEK